jgi:hypothetical protein
MKVFEIILEDWQKTNKRDKTDGMSQKAVNVYRRENPGSKLKTAVTTKPSKLKPGSKAANRRKSFCARMSGNKGPMKKPNGKPTPKALALRRWNCESLEEMRDLIEHAEKVLAEAKQGKLTKRQQTATRGIHTFGDAERANSDYVQFRVGMAAAATDGKTPPDIDSKSWIGKKKASFPYTKEEADILKMAYKAAGASYTDLNHGDLESKELDTTNKTSPVSKPKRNKYGV